MNEGNHLTSAGANLIKHFEGCLQPHGGKVKAYKCPANVTTIGWGTTGHGIDMNTVWTQEKCDAVFLEDMKKYEEQVRKVVTVHLTPWQWDALVSFQYNTGALAKSTLLKKVNALDFTGAAQEFHKWNKATVHGKKVELKGLTRRRASESLLFQNTPDYDYDGVADPKPPKEAMPQAVLNPDEDI